MSAKSQHKNIILAVTACTAVVAAVALIGFYTLGQKEESIQGKVEATEYRVAGKATGRILELRVEEGDYVKEGDTLAIIEAPEARARKSQAQDADDAASALDEMARKGARQEQVRTAFAVLQQTKAGLEIAEKSYRRMQRLFDEGVVSEQKRDEAFANYKAMEAQVKAAQSQYDMARNAARREERLAAAAQGERANEAAEEAGSYANETVLIAQKEGEVSEVYPRVGELVGAGSPIMSISVMNDVWGTFNVSEDHLNGFAVGKTFTAFIPAFNKDIEMRVDYVKDLGGYAVRKATNANGQYGLKTFEVKARPVKPLEGLRPGMSLVIKNP